jgi:hypothetical protein
LLAGEFLAGETILVDRDGEGGKLKFEKVAESKPVDEVVPVG